MMFGVFLLVMSVCSARANGQNPTTAPQTSTAEPSPIDCGSPANISNGTWRTNGSTTLDSSATLQCTLGYEPSIATSTEITCQVNGTWSYVSTTCKLKNLAYNATCYNSNPPQCITQNAVCRQVTENGDWRCLCNFTFFTHNSTTDRCAPTIPREVTLQVGENDVHDTSVTIILSACSNVNYTYLVYLSSDIPNPHTFNCSTVNSAGNQLSTFNGLSPGTLYTFVLTLSVAGVTSHTNKTLTQYTRPQTPDFVNLSSINETSMNVTWGFNTTPEGKIDGFRLTVSLQADSPILIQDSNMNSYHLQSLKGGTVYTVNVSSMIGNLNSETPQTVTDCTHPPPPKNGRVISQENDNIKVAYIPTPDNVEQYSIVHNGEQKVNSSRTQNRTSVIQISGLEQGTNYTFSVMSLTCNKRSLTPETIHTFTRPGPPLNVSIFDQRQTSLKTTWKFPRGSWGSYIVRLTASDTRELQNTTTAHTSYEFTGLNGSTKYTVHVQTVWRGLTSTEEISSSNTAPVNFTVSTSSIKETTLNFSVNQLLGNHVYDFSLVDTKNNVTYEEHGQAVKFTGLDPGRLYRLVVIATLGGVNSIYPTVVMVNTRPGLVENITISKDGTTNTSMAIKWKNPRGDFDNVIVNFFCTNPNNDSLNCSHNLNNGATTTTCPGLDPGTFCRVELHTKSGSQAGDVVVQNIPWSTKEEAPSSVINQRIEKSSRAVNITWNRPLKRNGIIRKYRVVVEDKRGTCNNTYIIKEIACKYCLQENASVGKGCKAETVDYFVIERSNESFPEAFTDTTSASFSGLVPGRNYTVTVIAYTKCWGPSTVTYVQTVEEVPKGPPIDIVSSATTDAVTINWGPPRCEDNTGVIEYYIVVVNYTNITCYPAGETTVKYFNTTSMTFVLNNTQPYNNYTYTISASTAIGHGPASLQKTQRTQAKEPDPVTVLHGTTITDTSVELAWKAPCFPNGILSKYIISIINRDTDKTTRVTSTESDKAKLLDLLPYRNYTFRVAPLNHENLTGYNLDLNITTQQGVPHIIEDLVSSNISGSSITVSWSPPDLYTGVTNYTVKSVDFYFNTSLPDQTIWGFNSTELTVGTLRAYWNYSISVEAATIAGINESHSINVQTLETKPGPIAKLSLFPETDVTKARTITVVWQEPKLEDKNGIITGYVIRYGHNNTAMLQVNVNAATNNTVLQNLSTGYITVQVAAETSIGEGDVTYNYTDVKPGAPLKFNESNGQPLMQPSSHGVLDSERQISIMLPLRSFFCNYTNGKTIKWGLVVAETSRTKGSEPYTGDVAGFYNTLETYRKWKDIKEADVIDPYIPTSSDWNPCNQTDIRLRNRRSVPDVVDMPFVIGADKDCDALDPNGFCNGQLAPGRSYSVRGFVCTEGGCTESEYSPGIKTDPDLTMPIVVGVLSGLVIVAGVALVIVFMKRRQKACFAMKVDLQDDVNLKETESAEMSEITQQETSVHSFKPCSVPLSEFPAHVTNMHKDSNLLFADAFKMIKENSPALPSNMAKSEACRAKNRYSNILAFDHSRVKLLPLEDVEGSDFINANYIPGCKSKRAYIATQGPLPATFDDFWRMIWEQNVGVIVMLTKLVEKGRAKCDMYWPKLGEPVFYGDLVACTRSESTLPDYALRVIELQLKDQIRTVRQFCFLKWPDMGCPDHPYLLLDFVRAVGNEYSPELSRRGPMVVHCSAGVGRTGTFIALDNLLQYVKENDTVDIYNLVLQMRHSRCNMVQTEDQFIYIYECLKESMTVNTAEEEVIEEEPVYGNTSDNVYENMGFSQT